MSSTLFSHLMLFSFISVHFVGQRRNVIRFVQFGEKLIKFIILHRNGNSEFELWQFIAGSLDKHVCLNEMNVCTYTYTCIQCYVTLSGWHSTDTIWHNAEVVIYRIYSKRIWICLRNKIETRTMYRESVAPNHLCQFDRIQKYSEIQHFNSHHHSWQFIHASPFQLIVRRTSQQNVILKCVGKWSLFIEWMAFDTHARAHIDTLTIR